MSPVLGSVPDQEASMFHEVTMFELKEVLRLRGKGLPKKRVAAQLGLDPAEVSHQPAR
jgi:hypothetical protein